MRVNIFEAKARLSALVDAVEAGARVTICRRNRPVAELMPVVAARSSPRSVGGAKGRLTVPPSFFEPLPDDVVDAFYPAIATPWGAAEAADGPAPRTATGGRTKTARARRRGRARP